MYGQGYPLKSNNLRIRTAMTKHSLSLCAWLNVFIQRLAMGDGPVFLTKEINPDRVLLPGVAYTVIAR